MTYEDGFVHLANRIKPDDGLRDRVLALGEQAPKRRRKSVLKYAVSFVLTAAVLAGGALILPRNLTGINNKAVQAGLTVYVEADANGASSEVPMTPDKMFRVRQDIYFCGEAAWVDDSHDTVTQLYQLELKCVGDGLSKVTYTSNKGALERKVNLTWGQFEDSNYLKNAGFDSGPAKAYVETREGRSTAFGYKKTGGQLTLDCGKSYDGVFAIKYDTALKNGGKNTQKETQDEAGQAQSALAEEIRNTKLKITAVFSDGSTCEKTVVLNPEKNARLITATLLD